MDRRFSPTWTEEEKTKLRDMLRVGRTVRDAAEALGRPVTGVQTMASRLGVASWDSILAPTRERMRDLAAEGWASSRIARRLQVPVEAVDFYTGRIPS
ncbi:hypothetical protein GCM10011390_18850 [Aureimonas endophytica]|uniref:Uncharacterized protein n=2 Tax=Aureimonas endophytica TaxID=2027858 RepID=A0A917E3S3_9HYPH|nr:hypothetical protein GCM10011390_18850 [Aureimonas endophytica]